MTDDCWVFNGANLALFFLDLLRLYWIYYLVDMISSSPVTTEGRTNTFVFEYCHEASSILEMSLWLFLAYSLLTFFSNIYFTTWLCENPALYFVFFRPNYRNCVLGDQRILVVSTYGLRGIVCTYGKLLSRIAHNLK